METFQRKWSFHPRSLIPEPAVILIVMRKQLMCSSCILWPTLCLAICLCQLPSARPPFAASWKGLAACAVPTCLPAAAGPIVATRGMQQSRRPSGQAAMTPLPGPGLEWHLRWQLPGWQPCLSCHCLVGNAWGPKATSALTIGTGTMPGEYIHATGHQCHSAGQSSSSCHLFLPLPSSLQSNGKLLGRDYPVISPQ